MHTLPHDDKEKRGKQNVQRMKNNLSFFSIFHSLSKPTSRSANENE
jgi:hypothetical protein